MTIKQVMKGKKEYIDLLLLADEQVDMIDGRLIIGDPLLEDWMSNRILGSLMQVLDGGVFTDKKRVSEYLIRSGFEDISIRPVPKTMKSLYLIKAKK